MTFQTIDAQGGKWSWRIGILVLVALATSHFLKTPELTEKAEKLDAVQSQLQTVQSKEIPKLQAKVGCEKWRADQTKKIAKQAIDSANSDTVPIPSTKAIPPDNCGPPGTK